MIKAVLLDLDNTLLHNPQREFVTAYLQALDSFFAPRYGDISDAVLSAIRQFKSPNTFRFIDDAIVEQTAKKLSGAPLAELRIMFAEFYQSETYEQLRGLTYPLPGAVELVQCLRAAGYALVIATNPLYPAAAITRRLDWAGLPLEGYALITHSGNTHFIKPDPAYYAEVIGVIGVEPDEAVMIGDDLQNDILPAQQLGLHTIHITDGLQKLVGEACGANWTESWIPCGIKPEMIQPELRGNAAALTTLVKQIASDQWDQHPEPKEWSLREIVCHLCDSEITLQRPRLERILKEDNPFLSASKPPPGPYEMICRDNGEALTQRFVQLRQETLEWLEGLSDNDWGRPARHSIFGPTTLLEMAHFTAQHDRLHLSQLRRTLQACA
jgi:HAD superfamily hydrolase (TIGR01509 family)